MQKRLLTIPFKKLLYQLARKSIVRKCNWKYGERMSEDEYQKCIGIINQCKK